MSSVRFLISALVITELLFIRQGQCGCLLEVCIEQNILPTHKPTDEEINKLVYSAGIALHFTSKIMQKCNESVSVLIMFGISRF